MERYRYWKKLSGKEVADLFEKYKVNDYIIRYVEILHVLGEAAVIAICQESSIDAKMYYGNYLVKQSNGSKAD